MVLTYPIYSLIFFVISLEYHRQNNKIQYFFKQHYYFLRTTLSLSLKMWFAGMTHAILKADKCLNFFPITVPGLSTELQPTSTWSPSIAPNFLRPVSPSSCIVKHPLRLQESCHSFTFDVIEPAPICDL